MDADYRAVRGETMTATRTLPLALLFLVTALTSTLAASQAPLTPDERTLTALVESWTTARSANDAEAMRPLFAEKVDRVNLPTGQVESTTRDELIAYFAKGFSGSAKGTRAKSIAIRPVLLSDTAGLVDHTYTMYNPDGSAIGVGHTTFIALKEAGAWKIVALRYASAWPQGTASSVTTPSR
jgi:uncharacterized protein (TIGR02246 family)